MNIYIGYNKKNERVFCIVSKEFSCVYNLETHKLLATNKHKAQYWLQTNIPYMVYPKLDADVLEPAKWHGLNLPLDIKGKVLYV